MIKNAQVGEFVEITTPGKFGSINKDDKWDCQYQEGSTGIIIDIRYPGRNLIAQNWQNRYHPPFIKVRILKNGFGEREFSPNALKRIISKKG